MTIVFGLALYAMIWWIVLFAVLPFGVQTQAEAGEVVPGTPESAPAKPRLGRVFLATSVIAAMVFATRLGDHHVRLARPLSPRAVLPNPLDRDRS